MSDFYKEMLQKSIDRQAKEIVDRGATEQDRYGNLLDSVRGRDLEQERIDKHQNIISNIRKNAEENRKQREKEERENSKSLECRVAEIQNRQRREADDFLAKHGDRLKKAEENIRRERNKTYFS